MPIGTFLLADIGGYTSFLSDVGIDHAKEITSHLFDALHAVDPDGWRVGNVAGDCLFLYNDAPDSTDTAFDHICAMYERFCEGIEEVVAGSTCRCGACDRSGALTIKFVVHAGEFDTQQVVGRTELIGPEIVVAHRLLKNTVPVREYALFTDAFTQVLGACPYDCISAGDTYGDIGSIDYRYIDLTALRDEWRKRREVYLTDYAADVFAAVHIDAPPQMVWELVRAPEAALDVTPSLLELAPVTGPMYEVGSVHTCFHGQGFLMVHQVIAVDDEARRTTELISNVPDVERMTMGWEVAENDSGGSVATTRYQFDPAVDLTDDTREQAALFLQSFSDNIVAGLKDRAEQLVKSTRSDRRRGADRGMGAGWNRPS